MIKKKKLKLKQYIQIYKSNDLLLLNLVNKYLLSNLFKTRDSVRLPNFGCFLVLRKPLLVRYCVEVWVLFSVFSIFCITSFGDRTIRNTKKPPEFHRVLSSILLVHELRMLCVRRSWYTI